MKWSAALVVLAACDGTTSTTDVDAPAEPLRVVAIDPQQVEEDATLTLAIATEGGAGDARVFLEGLPPGAVWDEATHTLVFVPDFLQGGAHWQVGITADDGVTRAQGSFEIVAIDTIHPPAPAITAMTVAAGFTRYTVTQTTDPYLDTAANAGRTFTAVVTVPVSSTGSFPVRVELHGFGGAPATGGSSGEIRIYPHDPSNTYWWGYGAPGPVPEYTARRVLNLLGWVLATYPTADPARVTVDGGSMGGAGAMTIGLLHARHVAHVRAYWGQAIAKNHRPSRVAQLQTLWGAPALDLDDGRGMGAWTRMDLTRALRDEPEARDQFLSIKHSKDDPTIHFGAAVMPSPLTQQTLYGSLQTNHVGHHAIWDEGGHGDPDPVLGGAWWTAGWDPVSDATALLRRDRAFPAFSKASIDRNPGTGAGNGTRAFNAESGYAGVVSVVGDTGWDGERAGGINRFLRWDGTAIVDTIDRFEIPLRVIDGPGGAPPRVGDPTTGDRLDGTLPVTVEVTPRRVQAFRTRPGEMVAWTIGPHSGTVAADTTGAVTVPVSLDTSWQALVLTRVPR
jgi:hypothetical protein